MKPEDVDVWRAVDANESMGGSPGIYAEARWVATFKRKADRDYVLGLTALAPDRALVERVVEAARDVADNFGHEGGHASCHDGCTWKELNDALRALPPAPPEPG